MLTCHSSKWTASIKCPHTLVWLTSRYNMRTHLSGLLPSFIWLTPVLFLQKKQAKSLQWNTSVFECFATIPVMTVTAWMHCWMKGSNSDHRRWAVAGVISISALWGCRVIEDAVMIKQICRSMGWIWHRIEIVNQRELWGSEGNARVNLLFSYHHF